MTKPKNFTIMYAVVRTELFEYWHWVNPVIIGVFESLEEAQDKADSWHQEMKDKSEKLASGFKFQVQSTIYYV